MSIQTALDSGKVDEKVANTILPMGATINMDGSALGYPCAVAFLAHTAKLVSIYMFCWYKWLLQIKLLGGQTFVYCLD